VGVFYLVHRQARFRLVLSNPSSSQEHQVKESTRQFYLASMGISMWYARESLPGAAASPEMDFSFSVAEPQPLPEPARQIPAAPRAQVSGKKGLQEVRQALGQDASVADDADAETQPATGPASEPVPVAHDRVLDPEPSTRMQAVVCRGDLINLVVEYGPDTTLELQLRLAENLLRALGESQPDFQLLQWPVFRNPRVPGNDREGLGRVLSTFMGEVGERPWLVLGTDAVAPLESHLQACGQSIWLLYAVSLQGLAADPGAKRELWQQIQARLRESPLEIGER